MGLGQGSDKPTGSGGVASDCPLLGPGVGPISVPTTCCPHVATLSTAGHSEASLHFHSLPPTQGFTSLGQAPEPLAWTRGKSTSNPVLHCAFPDTHDVSLALSYAAKALP